MNIGKGLHQESVDVDPAVLMRGLQDAMSGGKTLLTDEEAKATITQLQGEISQKMEAKAQAAEQTRRRRQQYVYVRLDYIRVIAIIKKLVEVSGVGQKRHLVCFRS